MIGHNAQFGTYVAILRKHLVLLVASFVVVAAAGGVYLSRQEPLFEAEAILEIHVPVRDVMRAREVENFLAIDPRELQNQMKLLRYKKELSAAALERLAGMGVDVAAAGYTEESLRNNVQVDMLPGTDVVRFALKGRDQATLPRAVEAYVAVYKEDSEDKSAVAYRRNLANLQTDFKKAKEALKTAEDAVVSFKRANADVNFEMRENPAREQWKALVATLPGLERSARIREQDGAAIRNALERLGVRDESTDDGFRLKLDGPSETSIERILAADPQIGGLETVSGNPTVQRLAEIEREAAQRLREIEAVGGALGARTAQLQMQVDRSSAERGETIRGILERELGRIQGEIDDLRHTRERVVDLETKSLKVLGLQLAFDEFRKDEERARRDYDRAKEAFDKVDTVYLKDDLTSDGPGPTRRIGIVSLPETAKQIAPNAPMILGLTLFAALAIGVGLVLLKEYLDDTVKSREDFDRYIGLPCLGFIPHIEAKDSEHPDLAAATNPRSPLAEQFRAVRTSILFSRVDRPVKTLLITSAGPGEGKTTVAANLAATFAKNKGPVLIIDADLRKPRVAKALQIGNERGLSNCLIGESTLEEAVVATGIEGLFALTSGPIPPDPAELLHSDRMEALLREASEKYDKVVIDSPPLIAVTDARVLASRVDGLYVVISMGRTSRRLIQRAIESVTGIGFEVHGTILNNLSAPTGQYGYYYYRDYSYSKGYYGESGGSAEKPTAT